MDLNDGLAACLKVFLTKTKLIKQNLQLKQQVFLFWLFNVIPALSFISRIQPHKFLTPVHRPWRETKESCEESAREKNIECLRKLLTNKAPNESYDPKAENDPRKKVFRKLLAFVVHV